MCWNPPDPSDYVDKQLASDDDGIHYLYLPDGDPYEIRVYHPDCTPTIEEYWNADDFNARLEDLKQTQAEYEVIFGPDSIPY